MTVYEITNDDGRLVAFQIPDVGKSRIRRILKRVQRSVPLEFRKNSDTDKRVLEFAVGKVTFEVVEMFDIDHRYWIGPIQFGVSDELDQLKTAFDRVSARRWF